MKYLFLILILFSASSVLAQHDMHNMPARQSGAAMPKAKPAQQVIYTCPMHPEIRSTKPGNCPKCGMKLVPVKTTPAPKTSVNKPTPKPAPTNPVAENPRDMPDMKGHDMNNMDMNAGVKKELNQMASVSYTCPMHPEIHSPKPGNCPKCGMKLVKEKQKNAPVNHDGMVMPNEKVKSDDMNMDHSKMNMDHSKMN